jgi:gamma-aminobutyric acid type B receptor
MLTKAWRIYKIVETSQRFQKIVLKDSRLVVYICCMLFVDFIIILAWQWIDPVELRSRYIYETEHKSTQVILPSSYLLANYSLTPLANSSQIELEPTLTSSPIIQNLSQINKLKFVFECTSFYNEVWVTALVIYKCILIMYGIYLAWIIRNINVPSMNDSKYLLLSSYTIILCGLGSMTLIQVITLTFF